jgi:WD40 repeat protein
MTLKRIVNRAQLHQGKNQNAVTTQQQQQQQQQSGKNANANNSGGGGSIFTMEGLSRTASGMCFSFPADNTSQYYCGTEDGLIHRCSVSYNEQTLDNYYGHTSAVYSVVVHPYNSDIVLTCSNDWSCCVWHSKQTSGPVFKLQASGPEAQSPIVDCVWSSHNSCVFACVTRSGQVQVWDLEVSSLDPVCMLSTRQQLTQLVWAPGAPALSVGCHDGSVAVYRLNGVSVSDPQRWSDEEQQRRLDDVLQLAMAEQKTQQNQLLHSSKQQQQQQPSASAVQQSLAGQSDANSADRRLAESAAFTRATAK